MSNEIKLQPMADLSYCSVEEAARLLPPAKRYHFKVSRASEAYAAILIGEMNASRRANPLAPLVTIEVAPDYIKNHWSLHADGCAEYVKSYMP